MDPKVGGAPEMRASTRERIVYIQQMLGQLSVVARTEGEIMLGYLIDMAIEEARDVAERRP